MGISAAYGQTDDAAARDTLEAAVEAGVTLIDTADMYGVGANEEFLAPFLAAHRDEITLATKFGIEYRADDPGYRAIRNDPGYIKKAVEASLRRLDVEVIDLYCTRSPPITGPPRRRSRWPGCSSGPRCTV